MCVRPSPTTASGQIFSYGFNRWAPETVTRGLASQFVVAEELQMAPVRKFCTGFDFAVVLYDFFRQIPNLPDLLVVTLVASVLCATSVCELVV
jgi:hypothetical protein